MKSFRWTLLFVVAVGALVAFTVFDFKRSNQQKEADEKAKKILKFEAADIQKVEILGKVTSTTLEKKDGKWTVQGGSTLDQADASTVNSYLNSLENEKTTQKVAGGDVDEKTFGLDQPVARLKVTATDGKTEEVKIGSVKAYDNSLYAEIDNDKTVWLVSSSWDPEIAKGVNDFRDKHIFRGETEFNDLKRIVLRQGSASTLELAKDANAWKVAKGGPDFPIAADKVKNYFDQLKDTQAKSFAGGNEKVDKPEFEVDLFTAAPKPVFAKFSAPIAGPKLPLDKKKNPDPDVVRAISSQIEGAVELSKPVVQGLKKTAQDFYDLKLPFKMGGGENDVAKMEIDVPGVLKTEFVKKGADWSAADPGLQKAVDSSKLNDLVAKLSSLEADKILEPLKKGAAEKMKNRVVLMKSGGDPVLEFAWNDPAGGSARARTNLSDFALAVNESKIKGLDFAGVLKPAATPTPAAPPTTGLAKPLATPPPPTSK